MNERKLFQSIIQNKEKTQKNLKSDNIISLDNFKQCRSKSLKKSKQSGITLIALVISIIVMMILAGVSLNVTIGDNGIITQAQNATYMQSIVALEEYLQTEYVKYYDETENYTSKIELLSSKLGNLCLKDGTKNYITYDGKMYYLINKQELPDDVKNQLKGGDTTEYLKYIRLQDVYGVTPDLKVYYCESGTDSALGTLDNTELDPNTPLKKINQDAEMKSAITEALASVGVTVGEDGVTVGDASKLKNVELDGSKHNITSISGLSELSSLKTVTLSNLNLNDLDGLQNCTLLYYVYFKNCKVNDYSKLATVLDLQYLYLYLPPSMSEADANAQVNNLGNGLANATELNKVEYFGIVGNTDMIENTYSLDTGDPNNKFQYNANNKSNLTDISALTKISDSIKSRIKYLYLNNNSFSGIEGLKDFTNIYEIDLMCNKKLINLDGLENHTSLVYVFAQRCDLQSIQGLKGNINLKYITIKLNSRLQSLSGLEDARNMDYIIACECNLTDITALNDNIKLRYLELQGNTNLEHVITLGTCTGIKKLYLIRNEKMIGTEVRDALADPTTHILQNCGSNYTIPSKYNIYFSTLTSYDYSNLGLTDDSDEINSLKNKTNVTKLNLSGNSNLTDEKLQEILSTMTGLKALSLNGCKNLKTINFVGQDKVTQLIELDIRDTSKELVNLSNLEKYAINLRTLIIDNTSTEISKIQKTINRISQRNEYGCSESNISVNGWDCAGFIPLGNMDEYNFNNCSEITKFSNSNTFSNNVYGMLDLSNCTGLKVYYQTFANCAVKFPSNLENLTVYSAGNYLFDISKCINLKKISFRYGTNENVSRTLNTLPINNILSELVFMRDGPSNCNFLSNFNYSNLKNLTFDIINAAHALSINNFDLSNYDTNLEKIRLIGADKVTNCNLGNQAELKELVISEIKTNKILGLNNSLKLINLNLSNSKVAYIEDINKNISIQKLLIPNNNFSDISFIKDLKNITDINLKGNNISDLTVLESTIINNVVNYKSLNLANNIIQTTTVGGHNNVETLKKLYNAGLRDLDISGNNFTTGSTDELKSLKWTSYKE